MNFAEAIEYLEHFTSFGIKPGLHRIQKLLQLLGNPQTSYKTIHVTGTNGKGSVTAYIFEILKASGYRCGRFTSPHLLAYNERIRVQDLDITDEELTEMVVEVKKSVDIMIDLGEESPTQFEVLTAIAFLYFKKKSVDYAVIEVGLGGLLDSTNVINPELSIITNVSIDHIAYCGKTTKEIAKHKAGIIKPNTAVITGAIETPLLVITNKAIENNARVYSLGLDVKVISRKMHIDKQEINIECNFLNKKHNYNLKTSLLGKHQGDNLALAIMAIEVLNDDNITAEAIYKGVENTYWPGRFEVLNVSGRTFILDGAHNTAGACSFAATYKECFGTKPKAIVMSILKDKAVDNIIGTIVEKSDNVFTVPAPTPRTMQPKALVDLMPCKAMPCGNVYEGIQKAINLSDENMPIVVCGSLYILGEAREAIEQQKKA